MANSSEYFMLRCDKSTAEYLKSEIKKITGAAPRESDIKGIGGEAEIIIFGTAALGALKSLLDLIKTCIETGRTVKGLKLGDREVNNPKASDIDSLQK